MTGSSSSPCLQNLKCENAAKVSRPNNMSESSSNGNNTRLRKKIIQDLPKRDNKLKNLSIKKVSVILKKKEEERTSEENELLCQDGEIAKEAASRLEKREQLKQREKEFEDSEDELNLKCAQLAEAVCNAEFLVVYTGAGISTAARIPDYRGTSGIWTLLQQGKDIGEHDLTQAEPTYTHMALSEMYQQGKLKHVVSQNCDGLHLRSGLPRTALSEVHGNMYIEVCRSCRPFREYLRLFDVTESTARFNHRTQRRCYGCHAPLADSIVHFGERGNLPWPLNWKGACSASEKADVILCLGSSLKVLKRYPWLWCMDKPVKRRPKLYIVNLQWTPKDCHAVIKIHGQCDVVMKKLIKFLGIQVPDYKRYKDPIFLHATPLCPDEQHTTSRHCLEPAEDCKEELIVITVESNPKLCCDTFKEKTSHDVQCVNFVDASRDVPVIMAPDVTQAPPFSSLMEAMFFNYLYTLISSLTSYQMPQTTTSPIPSTSNSTELSDDDVPLKKKMKPNLPMCSFCNKQYSSLSCLFYVKYEPIFKPNEQPCLCCDDEEDEEGGSDSGIKEEEEEKGDKEDSGEKIEKDEKPKTPNPGWYGRGCKKRVKKKR